MPNKKNNSTEKKIKKRTSPKKIGSEESNKKNKATKYALETDEKFPIVGIGASAGGLEALEAFFNNMPSDKNIAFVIIQHLSPKHKSIMRSLLSKCTKMEVFDVKDGMKINPNCVYLNPPDKNVTIFHGIIQLMDPIITDGINLPIDCFFKSLAEELGEKAICIILSGTATDGTLGLKAVKGAGGIAMVQDPVSAKYDGMPRSAIATDLVDYILPVENIPYEIIKYVQTPYIEGHRKIKVTESQFASYIKKVFALIRSATGHDFSNYKQNTIRRRIERRMAVHQISKLENYISYLQKIPAEVDTLFKDLLIGVTNFFRDSEAFNVLKREVLPDLIKKKELDFPIRIWIVGCSSGEEAYSIAILLSEVMEKIKEHINVQIFATDIDEQAIDNARIGIYPDSIAADVSQNRLHKFFIKEGNTYRVKKMIREMVIFAPQNIIKDPPFSKIDLLCCRNLLIYLNSDLQKKIMPLAHYTLNQDGVLFLGTSESIGEFTNLFSSIDNKWKIYRRNKFITDKTFDYTAKPFYYQNLLNEDDEKNLHIEKDIYSVAENIILQDYTQPGVLINNKYEIIHFIGKTDKYLEPPSGKASFNILKMAREGLHFKLSTALHNAIRQKKVISYPTVRIRYNKEYSIVDLTVRPLMESHHSQGYMLVMFNDRTPVKKSINEEKDNKSKTDSNPVIKSLEQELEVTKEHLQTTIEEMETSNEELKSTNEELQSVNEELQSANEELETSKEELQSTNEELITVNTELQKKVDELSEVNNDINNLLASTDIGTIFFDTNLKIRRFTPAMTKIFNLIKSDIGRPISDITSKIQYDSITNDSKDVLETLVRKEVEVQDFTGNWFSMRIAPYRTVDNIIDGIVIAFVDISEIKNTEKGLRCEIEKREKSEEELRYSEEKRNLLLNNFRGIAYQFKADKIDGYEPRLFEGAIEKITGYTEKDFLSGKIRWDKMVHPDDLNLVNQKYKNFLSPGHAVEYIYRIKSKSRQIRWIRDVAQSTLNNSDNTCIIHGVIFDITEVVKMLKKI